LREIMSINCVLIKAGENEINESNYRNTEEREWISGNTRIKSTYYSPFFFFQQKKKRKKWGIRIMKTDCFSSSLLLLLLLLLLHPKSRAVQSLTLSSRVLLRFSYFPALSSPTISAVLSISVFLSHFHFIVLFLRCLILLQCLICFVSLSYVLVCALSDLRGWMLLLVSFLFAFFKI